MDAYRLTNGFQTSSIRRGCPDLVAALLAQGRGLDARYSLLVSKAKNKLAEYPKPPCVPLHQTRHVREVVLEQKTGTPMQKRTGSQARKNVCANKSDACENRSETILNRRMPVAVPTSSTPKLVSEKNRRIAGRVTCGRLENCPRPFVVANRSPNRPMKKQFGFKPRTRSNHPECAERASSSDSLEAKNPSNRARKPQTSQKVFAPIDLGSLCEDIDSTCAYRDETTAGLMQLRELWSTGISAKLVNNEKLLRMYEAQRDIHHLDERLLWHGTTCGSAQEIITNGFNRSHAGTHGSKYGNGTYFTSNLRYAARFCGESAKVMFLCRVSVGVWAKGEKGMLEPPPKEKRGERCDSTVNDVENPTIWCVFRDFQAVPVIVFTETVPEA